MARPRPALAVCAALALTFPAAAGGPIDNALAVQSAMAQARDLLTANKPGDAVAVLEKQLPFADGSRAYLDLLRSAYVAEAKRLQVTNGQPQRLADLRTKLGLLGLSELPADAPLPAPTVAAVPETPPAAVTPPPAVPDVVPAAPPAETAEGSLLRRAAGLFNQGKIDPKKFELAGQLFQAAFGGKVDMTDDQLAAWAYCRVRVAADRLNRAGADPATAAEVAAEVEDALRLAAGHAGLQKVGGELLAAARERAGPAAPAGDAWEVVETASFRVRHRGQKPLADALAAAAEARRADIFARWSGPAGGTWEPKCEVVLHPTADAFAAATGQPAAATGRATVSLHAGRPTDRRVDLRADDPTAADDALPRELTHVVLADLFPHAPPPRWAAEGMAVLAASPAEVGRYLRTLPRCHQAGELLPIEGLTAAQVPPADRATGFHVGSVSLVEFLVRLKGEKAFLTFVRTAQRYGLPSAVKREYGEFGVGDLRQLEAAWLRAATSSARGQAQ